MPICSRRHAVPRTGGACVDLPERLLPPAGCAAAAIATGMRRSSSARALRGSHRRLRVPWRKLSGGDLRSMPSARCAGACCVCTATATVSAATRCATAAWLQRSAARDLRQPASRLPVPGRYLWAWRVRAVPGWIGMQSAARSVR
jgi:hypothetical protein